MTATADKVTVYNAGDKMKEVWKITHDGSDTGIDITPSHNCQNPVGSYTSYSVSGNTFSFLIAAGTNGEFSLIEFEIRN